MKPNFMKWTDLNSPLDNRYKEMFTMFKGLYGTESLGFRKVKDGFGNKYSMEETEKMYEEWKRGLLDFIKPYMDINYEQNKIYWMEEYIRALCKWWREYRKKNGDPKFPCSVNSFGLSQWLWNCIFSEPTNRELLNPYWLFVASKYPNGYAKLERWNIPSWVEGIDTLKRFFPQFQYRIYVDVNNIV